MAVTKPRTASSAGRMLSTALLIGCTLMFGAWAIDQWRGLAPLFWDGERATGAVQAVEPVQTLRKGKEVTRYTCTVAYRGHIGTFDARERCAAGSAVQVVYRRGAPRHAILVPDASPVPLAILKSQDGGRAVVAALLAATMLAFLLLPWCLGGARRGHRA